jgi:hypothetical protein
MCSPRASPDKNVYVIAGQARGGMLQQSGLTKAIRMTHTKSILALLLSLLASTHIFV